MGAAFAPLHLGSVLKVEMTISLNLSLFVARKNWLKS
jgi:hypothetical protein